MRFNEEVTDFQAMVNKPGSLLFRTDNQAENPTFSFFVVIDGEYDPRAKSDFLPVPHQWYHVAGTYDGTALKIYVNGQLRATQPRTGNIDISADSLFIGTTWYQLDY